MQNRLSGFPSGLTRLIHERDHVPVRAPLPSHRAYILSLSAYAGDATRSARDLLSLAARAETSEACGEIGGLQTGLRSARWDDCDGPRVDKGPRNAGSTEVTFPLLSSSGFRREVFTPAVTFRRQCFVVVANLSSWTS